MLLSFASLVFYTLDRSFRGFWAELDIVHIYRDDDRAASWCTSLGPDRYSIVYLLFLSQLLLTTLLPRHLCLCSNGCVCCKWDCTEKLDWYDTICNDPNQHERATVWCLPCPHQLEFGWGLYPQPICFFVRLVTYLYVMMVGDHPSYNLVARLGVHSWLWWVPNRDSLLTIRLACPPTDTHLTIHQWL